MTRRRTILAYAADVSCVILGALAIVAVFVAFGG
jgi:hypothetical protein